MRALTRKNGGVQLDEVPQPRRSAADHVRLRVDVAGLCRTDLYVARGRIPVREPLILGHEFSGTVEEGDDGSMFEAGDRVTAIPLMACGTCAECLNGRSCVRPRFLGVDLDGAFADQIVVPARNLRSIPASVDPRQAAYTEPVAAALAVLNAPLPKDGEGVVLGTSRIAELTGRILAAQGFRETRRLSVREAAGLTNAVDFAIETEADEATLRVLLEIVRPGGIAVLKSRPGWPVPVDIGLAVQKGISLFAVNYASFDRAIDLIASDALGLDDFLGDSYALEAFDGAFAASEDGASVKIFFQIAS